MSAKMPEGSLHRHLKPKRGSRAVFRIALENTATGIRSMKSSILNAS